MISQVNPQNSTNVSLPAPTAILTLPLQNRSVPVEILNSTVTQNAVFLYAFGGLITTLGVTAIVCVIFHGYQVFKERIQCCFRKREEALPLVRV